MEDTRMVAHSKMPEFSSANCPNPQCKLPEFQEIEIARIFLGREVTWRTNISEIAKCHEFNNFLPLLPLVCALCVSSALAVLAFGCRMSLIPGAHFKTRVILYNGYVFHRNKIVEKTGTTYYNWIDEEGPEAFLVHDRRHRTNNAIESFHSILMRYTTSNKEWEQSWPREKIKIPDNGYQKKPSDTPS
jgi:hypothetical protein